MSESLSNKRILYISYDGMTDPLGQSQVLPYVIGLSKMGFEFTLLSAEKPDRMEKYGQIIRDLADKHSIDWQTIEFTRKPPVIAKMRDLKRLKNKALSLHRAKNFNLVHCRSYVSVEAGLMLHRKFGTDYLFDMRGFWVDERVDGGIWNVKNPIYALAYRVYKMKERDFLNNASHIITLTEAAKRDLKTWKNIVDPDITVIPCSADFELFTIPEPAAKLEARELLGIKKEQLVISYLGSIGTWYLLDEMLDFLKVLEKSDRSVCFLFITPESESFLKEKAKARGIDPSRIMVRFAKRNEVNFFLGASDLSLFFIKQCYSKISSSPTKQGELLAMGIPVITNSGIGDVDSIVRKGENGFVMDEFNAEQYRSAVAEVPGLLKLDPHSIRSKAVDYYDLNKALSAYHSVYQKILSPR